MNNYNNSTNNVIRRSRSDEELQTYKCICPPHSAHLIQERIDSFSDVLRFVNNDRIDNDCFRDAVKESLQIDLIKLQIVTNRIEYLLNNYQAARAEEHWYVYDVGKQRMLNDDKVELKNLDYKFGYSQSHGFVTLSNLPGNMTGKMLIGQEIEFIREREILRMLKMNSRTIAYYSYIDVKYNLFNGVPGCGKTHSIIEMYMRNPDDSIICTATRSGRREVIEKLVAKGVSKKRAFKDVRTYDSVTMHNGDEKSILLADEFMMVHVGQILIVVSLLKIRVVYAYGDLNQIPYDSRLPDFECRFSKFTNLREVQFLPVTRSYRLGKNAVSRLKLFYGEKGISSVFGYNDTMEIENIDSINQIVYDSECKYVTFTQDEKTVLNNYFHRKIVNTVHEVQGMTFTKICLVRLHIQDNVVYNSRPHIIVAISRHTQCFKYCTVVQKDTMIEVLRGNYECYDFQEFLKIQPQVFPAITARVDVIREIVSEFMENRFPFLGNMFQTKKMLEVPEVKYQTKLYFNPYTSFRTRIAMPFKDLQNFLLKYVPIYTDKIIKDENKKVLNFQADEIYNHRLYQAAIVKANKKVENLIECKIDNGFTTKLPNDIYTLNNAINKRNRDPPLMNVVHDHIDVKNIVDRFMKVYIDSEQLRNLKQYAPHANVGHYQKWMSTRSPRVQKIIEALNMNYDVDYLENHNLVVYESFLKDQAKVKFDGSHFYEDPAGQIVTAMDNELNAAFTPYIKILDFYIKGSLKDGFYINDGITMKDLNAIINKIASKGEHKFLETDFSKYDKSQESLALEVFCEIMRRFDIPEEVIELWHKCHCVNYLRFRKYGISIKTRYQRRSGDVATFLGNTLILMATLAYCLPMDEYLGAVFGGDDSLILVPADVRISREMNMFATKFNFYIKIEDTSESVCYASKFLMRTMGGYYFVPDPVKMIVKLCRSDMKSVEHLEQFRESYYLMSNAFCHYEIDQLVNRCEARYPKMDINHELLVRAILAMRYVLSSKRKFMSLFNIKSEAYKNKMPDYLKRQYEKTKSFYKELV